MSASNRIVSSPTELPGCAVWLDASDATSISESGGLVSQWRDKSGNANHFTAGGANRPTYTTFNGNAILSFDGVSNRMQAASNIVDDTGSGSTIVVVARKRSAPGTGSKGVLVTRANAIYFETGTVNWGGYSGGFRLAGEPAGTAMRVFSSRRGANQIAHGFQLRVNGASKGNFTSGASELRANTELSPNTQQTDVDVFAVVIYSRVLSDGELSRLEGYFNAKYQLYPARRIDSPIELPDCAMWFDAGQGVTHDVNGVSQWNDSSGNARHIAQSDNAFKPTYNPSNAAYAGRPTVDWDTVGNGDRLDRGSADNIPHPFTIFAVANLSNTGATPIALFDNATGAECAFQRLNGSLWNYFAGQSVQFPTPAVGTLPFVFTLAADGVGTRIAVNGVTPSKNQTGGTNQISTLRLGTLVNGFTTQNWNGSIAEFIVFRRRLPDGEIALVEAYLRRKYRIVPVRTIASPLEFTGCIAWLDAAQGITSSDPTSLAAPNDFSSVSWTKASLTVTPNVATDPFGGQTADLLTDVSSGVTGHVARQNVSGMVVASPPPVTFSVYLKAGTIQWVNLSGNDGGVGAWFDLVNGHVGLMTSVLSARITPAGDGWHLCSITYTPTTTRVDIYLSSANGVAFYAGTGTGTAYIYGATVAQASVSQWNDLSGNNNHFVQATAALRPTYQAVGGPGRYPTVFFDGVDDEMDATSNISVPAGMSVFAVLRLVTNATTRGVILATREWLFQSHCPTAPFGPSITGTAGDAAVSPISGKGFRAVSAVNSTTAALLRVDGETLGGAVAGSNTRTTTAIGRDPSLTTRVANMQLCELFVFNRLVNDGERFALERYLETKYGL